MSKFTALLNKIIKRDKISSRTLSFRKEDDGDWYAVIPEWKLPRWHLKMVAGADDFLDYLLDLSDSDDTVTIHASVEKMKKPDYILEDIPEESNADGHTYAIADLTSPEAPYQDQECWLCPVLEWTFGQYPSRIYVKHLNKIC